MSYKMKTCRRKAAWLAFGLVALSSLAKCSHKQNSLSEDVQITGTSDSQDDLSVDEDSKHTSFSNEELDQKAEALRAYKQAMHTLSTLNPPAIPHTYDPSLASGYHINSKSFLSTFLPSFQGRGPIGSIYRIIMKLNQQFMTGFTYSLGQGPSGTWKRDEELHRKSIKVLDLLQHSADLGYPDAYYALAQVSLFPPTSFFPMNPKLAYDCLVTHSALTGNATSQALIAFFHASGYHDIVPVNQALAQLYYTFSANGGDRVAQRALGYRYWSGIGTLEDCERALDWYELASEQAMAAFISGPPGGRTLPQTATRLSDLVGGPYGPGASVASTGMNANRAAIRAGISQSSGETWADILDYYMFNANRGETDFAYRLGKIYYQGSLYPAWGGIASGSEGVGAVPRDFSSAQRYFLQIARLTWPKDPPNPFQHQTVAPAVKEENPSLGYSVASAAYLGRMYLRGEGVKQDIGMAKMWFERGAEYGERECHNGLGIIYRDGLVPGQKPDLKKALYHFNIAAGQELAEAQVNIAKLHFARGEFTLATGHFEAAVRFGSPFEAYYYLGKIHSEQALAHSHSSGYSSGSCAMAVSFHKLVAERGCWDNDLLRDAEAAWLTGTERGKQVAMLKWWIAAEAGSEIAQNNLAFVLDQDKSMLRLTRFSPITPSNDTARLALTQWIRAAGQRNIDALVKVGDYYYHGLGVSDEPETTRFEKAARYYQSAADTQMSALAMWNLGWMYENGVGVPRDFHLAKRHYDLALETNPDAYLPVLLSLAKLYIRSFWHTVMGGQSGLSIWELEEEITPPQQRTEIGALSGGEASSETTGEGQEVFDDDEGSPWYLGKAKDEFYRRKFGQAPGRLGEEEDPIQWARDRRTADQDRDSDFGPEDYFEAALRGVRRGEDQEDSDEFTETMLLLALCLLVAALIYMRTRMVDRIRREQQQQRQRQRHPEADGERIQGNGEIPPIGDLGRNQR